MNKRKKITTKYLSNRQKVKEQAKEIQKLKRECMSYEVRNNFLRTTVLEKQKLINEQDKNIESLKGEIRDLEIKMSVKKPFWKKVFG